MLSWLLPRKKRAANHLQEGVRLAQGGGIAAAAERFARAAKLDPGLAPAHFNLGSACRDLGQLDQALAAFRRAAELRPDAADIHLAIGAVLRELGRLEEAIAALQRSLAADRGCVEAHQDLGNAHTALGNWREALGHFRSAAALQPESAEARWAATMAQIPAIPASEAESAERRNAFATELEALEQWLRSRERPTAWRAVAIHQPFYLAYQETSNVELLRRYGKLSAELMAGWQTRAGLAVVRTNSRTKKVGIVSAHIHDHSVWKALVRGWIDGLDERFELHLFHLGGSRDAETRHAAARATAFHEGRRGFEDWARLIHSSHLDVLIYPEIGMDATTGKLAALRLAPVQATSWGHPETSGLPTMDYFISAAGLEPAGAQANYTEKLVLLPNLGVSVSASAVKPEAFSQEGTLLVCPGTPFKYMPQFDRMLREIARRVPEAQVLFFAGKPAALSEKLERRLGLRNARFLPWMSPARFRGVLERADLFLDTIGFSGFNTALAAVESGIPTVTREGRFMRGRFASGILQRMGIPELVASSEDEYIELAVSLALDAARKKDLRKRIEANRAVLFDDPAPVAALQEFLEKL